MHVYLAIAYLKVFGWLTLVGTLVFSVWVALQAASATGTIGSIARGFYFWIFLSSLLTGVAVWAMCIAVASIAESMLENRIMDDETEYEEPAPEERRVTRHAMK